MGTFASELKSEREKRKISLAQIAAETRISLRHLESLEEGRYADLPGGIYNRAFLKAYCEILRLDPADVMQRYEDEISTASEKAPKARVHIPQQTRSLRVSPVAVWGLMLLISAAGIFFSRKWIGALFSPYFSHSQVATSLYEPVKPQETSKPLETQPPAVSTPVQAQAPSETKTTEPAPPPPPAAAPETVTSSTQSPQVRSATELGLPATPSPAPTTPPPLRLEISATEKCWISVDRDGSPAIRKVMEPGEVQSFTAAEKFTVILGNAGGVQIKVNGKQGKMLGRPGEVVKVIIDEKNLQNILGQTSG